MPNLVKIISKQGLVRSLYWHFTRAISNVGGKSIFQNRLEPDRLLVYNYLQPLTSKTRCWCCTLKILNSTSVRPLGAVGKQQSCRRRCVPTLRKSQLAGYSYTENIANFTACNQWICIQIISSMHTADNQAAVVPHYHVHGSMMFVEIRWWDAGKIWSRQIHDT